MHFLTQGFVLVSTFQNLVDRDYVVVLKVMHGSLRYNRVDFTQKRRRWRVGFWIYVRL